MSWQLRRSRNFWYWRHNWLLKTRPVVFALLVKQNKNMQSKFSEDKSVFRVCPNDFTQKQHQILSTQFRWNGFREGICVRKCTIWYKLAKFFSQWSQNKRSKWWDRRCTNWTSAWDDFPNFYKITGLEILVSFDTVMTKRKTYDLLSLLSDMGGLFQALTSVFSILISWYANFNTGVFMM